MTGDRHGDGGCHGDPPRSSTPSHESRTAHCPLIPVQIKIPFMFGRRGPSLARDSGVAIDTAGVRTRHRTTAKSWAQAAGSGFSRRSLRIWFRCIRPYGCRTIAAIYISRFLKSKISAVAKCCLARMLTSDGKGIVSRSGPIIWLQHPLRPQYDRGAVSCADIICAGEDPFLIYV